MFDYPVNVNIAPTFSASRAVTATQTRMVPVSFGACFGWLHSPVNMGLNAPGIVLCATFGQEARHVHRQWRILADRLAAEGRAVLRFDYPQTGDSWNDDSSATLLEAWTKSVVAATAFLRDRGISDITLVGLRFGATLAALAQARMAGEETRGADRLIMLAPVVSGRLYIRELRMTSRIFGTPAAKADDDLEAGGMQIDAATCRAISTIDLQNDMRGQGPVLILDPGDIHNIRALTERLRSTNLGPVTATKFDDFAEFTRNSHTNSFPEASFAQISTWLHQTAPAIVVSVSDRQTQNELHELILHPEGTRERPCQFGADGRLFGMLCEPRSKPTLGGDIVVIFCNNGSNPHYGHGRFAVTSGRDLAKAGIASFRMDFAGLGDSAAGPDEQRPHLFDASRDGEITEALNHLERFGYRRFILTGICAGAYHAFHGALADHRVVGIYAVNLPKFRWPVGDDPDQVIAKSLHATRYYLEGVRRPETWLRLLRNEIDVRTVTTALLRRLTRRIATKLTMPLALRFGSPSGTGFPRWAVSALLNRGVQVHFLYGHDDAGVEELVRCFGTGGRKLLRLPGCTVEIPNDVDHAISYAAVRQAVHLRFLTFVQSVVKASP